MRFGMDLCLFWGLTWKLIFEALTEMVGSGVLSFVLFWTVNLCCGMMMMMD